MIAAASSWLLRKKWILAGIGVPVLVAAWWASVPKNFGSISRSVSRRRLPQAAILSLSTPGCSWESAPDKRARHNLSGRDGKRDLRLTDFTTSNGPDVHVLLAQSADQNLTKEFVKGDLDSVELGF